MQLTASFGEVLELADKLSLDEQQSLMEILLKHKREQPRIEIAKNIQAARKEFLKGQCQPATPQEIMKDILS